MVSEIEIVSKKYSSILELSFRYQCLSSESQLCLLELR